MNPGDLFTSELWQVVADDLRHSLKGVALAWWEENRERLTSIAKDEVIEIAQALRHGDTVKAKFLIACKMEPAEFALYVTGTSEQLRGIARRRAELIEALEDLGMRTAKAVSEAVIAAVVA